MERRDHGETVNRVQEEREKWFGMIHAVVGQSVKIRTRHGPVMTVSVLFIVQTDEMFHKWGLHITI